MITWWHSLDVSLQRSSCKASLALVVSKSVCLPCLKSGEPKYLWYLAGDFLKSGEKCSNAISKARVAWLNYDGIVNASIKHVRHGSVEAGKRQGSSTFAIIEYCYCPPPMLPKCQLKSNKKTELAVSFKARLMTLTTVFYSWAVCTFGMKSLKS
jgi:hypothetical protein